jgi:arylsulfatase A-like enzyme
LLISLDTLRADHTGFGGYSKPTTPFLDSLAERAVVFDNHFANSNCTLPSHATMLTGLHYPSHGVKPTGEGQAIRVIPQSVVTIAESFQEAGFATSAFTSHGAWLNKEHGFAQGFDHFVSRWCDADLTIKDYLAHIDAIVHTTEFEYSDYSRDNLVYKFQTLSPEQIEEKRRLLEAFRQKEAAEKAAAPKPEKAAEPKPEKPNNEQ